MKVTDYSNDRKITLNVDSSRGTIIVKCLPSMTVRCINKHLGQRQGTNVYLLGDNVVLSFDDTTASFEKKKLRIVTYAFLVDYCNKY